MEYRDLIKNHKSFMAFILLAKEAKESRGNTATACA